MMLKEIIKQIKEKIKYYTGIAKEEEHLRNTYYFGALDKISILKEFLPNIEKADQLQDKIIEYLRSLQIEMCSLTQFAANIDDHRQSIKQILELIDNPSGTKEIVKICK
jgi:hypothetical protein